MGRLIYHALSIFEISIVRVRLQSIFKCYERKDKPTVKCPSLLLQIWGMCFRNLHDLMDCSAHAFYVLYTADRINIHCKISVDFTVK